MGTDLALQINLTDCLGLAGHVFEKANELNQV